MVSPYRYFKALNLEDCPESIDWSPDITFHDELELSAQRALFSLSSTKRNYIQIEPFISTEKTNTGSHHEGNKILVPGNGTMSTTIEIPAPALKAKFMPFDSRNIVAVSTTGEATMYSLQEERFTYGHAPQYTQKTLYPGSNFPGTVLSFHPTEKRALLSATCDGIIRLHDVKKAAVTREFNSYSHEPLDASWSRAGRCCFATIGSDSKFNIWDTRNPNPCSSVVADSESAHTIDFSHDDVCLFLTGGTSLGNAVWDVRNTSHCLAYLRENVQPVLTTKWSPHKPGVFASCGKVGEAFVGNYYKNGELKVIFKHKEHDAHVHDIKWHPRWNMLTSIDKCKEVHFWQPNLRL